MTGNLTEGGNDQEHCRNELFQRDLPAWRGGITLGQRPTAALAAGLRWVPKGMQHLAHAR